MLSVCKISGPSPGEGKLSTKGTFQSELSHLQKHGSKTTTKPTNKQKQQQQKCIFGKMQTIWYILSIGYK